MPGQVYVHHTIKILWSAWIYRGVSFWLVIQVHLGTDCHNQLYFWREQSKKEEACNHRKTDTKPIASHITVKQIQCLPMWDLAKHVDVFTLAVTTTGRLCMLPLLYSFPSSANTPAHTLRLGNGAHPMVHVDWYSLFSSDATPDFKLVQH